MIETETMNRWLSNHKNHNIRFYRRRHTDAWKDREGHVLPDAAGVSQVVLVVITCDDCHTGVTVGIEDDTGQETDG